MRVELLALLLVTPAAHTPPPGAAGFQLLAHGPHVGVGDGRQSLQDVPSRSRARAGDDRPAAAVPVLDQRLVDIVGVRVVACSPGAPRRQPNPRPEQPSPAWSFSPP